MSPLAVSQEAPQDGGLAAQEKLRPTSLLPAECAPYLSASADRNPSVEYSEAEISKPSMSAICGARIALAQHRTVSFPNTTASKIKEMLGVTLPEPHIAVGFHTRSGTVEAEADGLQKARLLSLTPDRSFRENFVKNSLASFASDPPQTISAALYLDPGGRLHMYEGVGGSADQAQSVSLTKMKQWTEQVRSHSLGSKPRDPLPLGPDPATVPSVAWTFLFDLTVSWTDGNNTPFTVTLTTYRLNEYDTKDWYVVLTEFDNSAAPNFSCPAYNNGWGQGWCVVREPQGITAMLSPGTFGHGGAYGTQAWIDPGTKRIYILMVQRANFPNSDASEVRRGFQEAASEAFANKTR